MNNDDDAIRSMIDVVPLQRAMCHAHGAPWVASPAHRKVGLARNARTSLEPLNGLRHSPRGDTTGWYIWAGATMSAAADFFEPIHVEHLREYCPAALRFLGRAPGWRFLTDGAYVDVWEDRSLLIV